VYLPEHVLYCIHRLEAAGYPTYAVADRRSAASVQRFELIGVDAGSFIAVVMLSDSQVKSQLMRLDLPVDGEHLSQLTACRPGSRR
jgi:transcriptional regulator of heat shock response